MSTKLPNTTDKSIQDLYSENPNLVTIQKAAQALKVSKDTLRRWEAKGKITSIRTTSGYRLYDLKTLSKTAKLKPQTETVKTQFQSKAPIVLPITSQTPLVASDQDHHSFYEFTNLNPEIVKLPSKEETEQIVPVKKVNDYSGFSRMQNKPKGSSFNSFSGFSLYTVAIVAILFLVSLATVASPFIPVLNQTRPAKYVAYLIQKQPRGIKPSQEVALTPSRKEVLSASSIAKEGKFLQLNLDTNIVGNLAVEGEGVFTEKLTAPNIVYSLVAGNNISITGDAQNPTISSTVPLPGDATNTTKGIASFSSDFFTVSAGAVSIADSSITNTQIKDGTITNSDLANTSITINAGSGLSGGGTVALGGSISISAVGSTSAVNSITGTANQVIASASVGDITLSLPQDIALTSSPTFSGVKLSGATSGTLTLNANAVTTDYTLTLPADDGTNGYILQTDGNGNTSWVSSACATCILNNPSTTQTITPTSTTATGLSVAQAATGSVDIFNVTNNGGSTKYFQVDSSGNIDIAQTLNLGTGNVSFYTGSGAPGNGTGSNGDYYFRSDGTGGSTSVYYKVSGSWVSAGGGTLQSSYDAGNTITTTTGRDIAFTLASGLVTSTSVSITNAGTATAFVLNDTNGATNTSFDIQSGGVSSLTINEAGTLATSGNISTTGSGTITSAGLLTGSAGITVSGGTASINTTGTANTAIGNATGTFALTSNAGLNVTTGGALTGVASIDTIATSATNLTFAGAGTIASTTSSALTLDSGTTGALNLGTGNNSKTINIGTGTAGNTINIATDNSNADTINIGSALDTAILNGTVRVTSLSASSAVYTDASKNLTSTAPTSGAIGYWSRTGTTLSPTTSGDNVTTSGNISTTGTGTITSAGTLTASNGFTQTTGALTLTSTSGAIASTGLTGLTFTLSSGTAAITAPTLNLNTSSTGNTALGNATGTFALTSSALNITTAGAISGATTFSLSGAISDTDSAVTINDDLDVAGTTGLTFTGVGGDITFTNGETIDNDTNNQINVGLGSSGTLLLSSTTTASITNSAGALNINAQATALNLQADGSIDVTIAGGSGATGCTVTNSSGALACTGAITGSNISGSTSGTNTGDQNLFSSIVVPTQTTITANSTTTALNVAAGSGVTLATDNSTKTLTISATGTGGDITAVGDVLTGAAFTSGGSGNSLYFNNNTNVGQLTATTLTGTQTWTLPDASGTVCVSGSTCASSGTLGYWSRTGTTLSPSTSGDSITTSGDISTTGTGALTVAGTFDANGQFDLGDGGDAGTIAATTLDIDATGALQINSSGGAISIGNDAVAQNINIGTGAAARTLTLGNSTSTTALNFTSGTGSQTFASSKSTGTTTSSAFVFNASSLTTGTALYVTSGATSGKTVDINATQTSGTIFNLAYGSAKTLTGDLTGLYVDLNSGNVDATNQNLTGVNFKIPTVTDTHTTGTKTLTGMLVNFGSGAGINQNGAGGTLEYIAGDFHLPALTETAGTLNAYGTKITTPATITTGGTAYGSYISATGVGAGSLSGVGISSITGGSGTEYALNIGSGWDAVLRVGSTTVINGSGVTVEAGGGTGQSTYATGDILYASGANTLAKRAIGNPNEVLTVVGGVPTWSTITGASCTNCVVTDPTADQVIAPSGVGTTGLAVRQTSTALPTDDIFQVTNSAGSTKYFWVDKDGNVSTAGTSSQTLTLTPLTDTTALTLVGTNVTTQPLQYINSNNSQGNIISLNYGAAQTLSTSTALTAFNIDLSTNVTATNASVMGTHITLPGATNTHTTGNKTLTGFSVDGGSINQNGAGGTTIFTAFDATIPAITQTAGTMLAYGINVNTPSSITTGGTASGLNVTATGVGAGTLNGLNIGSITGGAGTENGIQIGSGWDNNLLFNDTTSRVALANGGTLTIVDTAGNSLCTITDNSTVGDLSCTGTISGTGSVGYWTRTGSTLTTATASDNVTVDGTTTANGTLAANGQFNIGDGGDAGTINATTLDIDASGALQINSSGGAISIGNDAVAQAINIGTGAAARTITTGNSTGATALNFTSGTGSQTFASSVATTLTTSSAFVFTANSLTSGTGAYVSSSSITTGKLFQLSTGSANTLTSGTLGDIRTTSTALTGSAGTGSLLNLDWTPGSSTTATGDLFALNIGSNGTTTGNLFNILDSGSSIFSISENQVTTSLPANFTSPGDVSIAYDINFTNPVASYIKSYSALTIQPGDSFGSSNLTLSPYNEGSVYIPSNVATAYGLDVDANLLSTGRAVDISSSSTAGGASGSSYLLYLDRSGANSNATHTAYGLYSSIANTGTTNVNIGIFSQATGAITNYGIQTGAITSAASGTNYQLNLGAISGAASATSASINTGAISGAGTSSSGITLGANSATATTNYGLNIGAISGAGTTNYGINIAGVSGASTNYAIYVGSGSVNIQGLTASSAVYTDSNKNLTSTAPTSGTIGYWSRTGTTLSPATSGDNVTTSGNLSTSSTGTITSAGLLTGSAGLTVTGVSEFRGTINASPAYTTLSMDDTYNQFMIDTYNGGSNTVPSGVAIKLGDAASAAELSILDSTGSNVASIDSDGNFLTSGIVNITTLNASSAVYTDGSKNLTSTAPTSGTIGYWSRTGTTLSPATAGDNVTTTGNISTTSSGTLTIAGTTNLNGTVTLGDATADDITFTGYVASSILPKTDDTYDLGDDTHRWANIFLGGETLHLGTSTTDEGVLSYTTASNTLALNNAAAGIINIGTSALQQVITIGNTTSASSLALKSATNITLSGTATGTSATQLVLPIKTDSGDPTTTQTDGAMYYNSNSGKFRCYEGGAWANCIGSGGASPFTSTGGVITQTTGTDKTNLVVGETGDYGLLVSTSVVPTVDMVQITNGNAAVADGVDGLAVNFTTGDGTNPTNSGININLTSGGTASGDVLNGINLALTGTSGTEKGINFADNNFDLDINATTDLNLGIGGTSALKIASTGITSIGNVAHSITDSAGALVIDSNSTSALNIGTGSNAKTITIGNATGATALAFNSGTGPQTHTSQVVSGTTTTSAFVFDATAINTGTGMYLTSDSITTGKLAQISTAANNTLTTGTLLDLRTTATSLTGAAGTGSLMNLDWSPGSSTLATGDLFSLNIGTNGTTTGNLFNILDSGSSIFSISETSMTTSLPSNFTAAGDVAIAYDLNFTNPTASYIKSSAPLAVIAGETFNSSNLTLGTYNQGTIVLQTNNTTSTAVDMTNTTLTTGTAFNMSLGAITTGSGLSISTSNNTHTTGTLVNIASSSTAQTSPTLLNVAQTGGTTGINGGAVVAVSTTASTNSGARGLTVTANSMTTGVATLITANAITSGHGLSVASSSTGNLSQGLVRFNASGAHSGTAFQLLSGATGGGAMSITTNSITTGTALTLSSSTTGFSSGGMFSITKTGASGSTAFTGDIANIAFSHTFSGGTVNHTGNLLDMSRALVNQAAVTHTVSGSLLTIADSMTTNTNGSASFTYSGDTVSISRAATRTTGTIANSGNLMTLTSSDASHTGNTLSIADSATHASGGSSLLITASAITSGQALALVGPSSSGVTGNFINAATDVGSGGSVMNLSPDFSGSAVTGYGLNITGTETTNTANAVILYNAYIRATGNAAKTIYGIQTDIGTSSTTADFIYGGRFTPLTTGAISAGIKQAIGAYGAPAGSGTNTGGTAQMYGFYANPSFTAAGDTSAAQTELYGIYTTSSMALTTNGNGHQYGVYVADGTSTTTGSTDKYGIYVAAQTGADANYGAYFGSSVGIGTTTPTKLLQVHSTGSDSQVYVSSVAPSIRLGNNATYSSLTQEGVFALGTGAAQYLGGSGDLNIYTGGSGAGKVILGTAGAARVSIATNGDTTFSGSGGSCTITGAGACSSDARLKRNVSDFSSALDKIMSLRPVTYQMNPEFEDQSTHYGFIAQEIQPIFPELVSSITDPRVGTHFGLNYSGFVVPIVKSIQDLNHKVENALLSINNEGQANSLNLSKLTVSGDIDVAGLVTASDYTLNASDINRVGVLASLPVDQQNRASVSDTLNLLAQAANDQESRIADLQAKEASTAAALADAKVLGEQALTQTSSLQDSVASTSATIANLSSQIEELFASITGDSNPSEASPSDQLINQSTNQLALTPPAVMFASDSATLDTLTVNSQATVSGQLTAYEGIFQNSLKSLGDTFLGKTNIAGDLSVDGTFSVTEGSKINALPVLYFQTSALAEAVDFFNGLVTITKDGAIAAKEIVTEQISVKADSSAGTVVLVAGQTEIPVLNDLVESDSIIILTSETTGAPTLAVADKVENAGFVVKLGAPYAQDIKFSYLIVGQK